MTQPLKPFFSYFGSKCTLSKKYPAPSKDILIEPFAGSACYSLHYPHKQVKLFDKYEVVCRIWDYLIHVSEEEILGLPLIDFDKSIDDYSICQEAKYLIGFWLMLSGTKPVTKHTSRSKQHIQGGYVYTRMVNGIKKTSIEGPRLLSCWTEKNKQKIANQLQYIRHWKIEQKSYDLISNEDATWFIDPPYQKAGKAYTEPSKNIDFNHLSEWCKDRQGEVIVCENAGASWLPFTYFSSLRNFQNKQTHEVLYCQGFNETQFVLFHDEN